MSYAPRMVLVLNLRKTVFRGPSNAVAKDFRPFCDRDSGRSAKIHCPVGWEASLVGGKTTSGRSRAEDKS